MIRTYARTIHILGRRESFLCSSTSSVSIVRGVKKRRSRDASKYQSAHLGHALPTGPLDPLESIKPPSGTENDTSSKLFKVRDTYSAIRILILQLHSVAYKAFGI